MLINELNLGQGRSECCNLTQDTIVAWRNFNDTVFESLGTDLCWPFERKPPVAAVHLSTGLISNPRGLIWPQDASPDDLLHGGEPLPEPGGESPDAEDVGEEAVADDGSTDHSVLPFLPSSHQTSEEESETVGPGQEAILLPPSLDNKRDVETKKKG